MTVTSGGNNGATTTNGGNGGAVTTTVNAGNTATTTNGGNTATTTTTGGGISTSTITCDAPDLSLTINLLGLNIDVEAYLELLSDLLESLGLGPIGAAVGNLLGLQIGSGSNPTSIIAGFRGVCGLSFANRSGGTTVTASNAQDCLNQCTIAAVRASGTNIQTCAGATLDLTTTDGNCLFFIGNAGAPLSLATATRDSNALSFVPN